LADAQGNQFQFGDPTGASTSYSAPGGVAPGTTYTPGAVDNKLYVEVSAAGVAAFVYLTGQELHDAIAAGRHVYEPTSSEVLTMLKDGRLNPEQLPDEVRTELGRLQHADPSIGPVFQTPALAGDSGAGADGGFHFDPNAIGDPITKDATDWYYKLYGISPPEGYIDQLKSQYTDIYSIKAAILAQARKDKAPGLATLTKSQLSPQEQRLSSLTSAAETYYFELYGRPSPPGEILKMAQSGMSLFGIQQSLLKGAKAAGAPGYADVRFQQEVSSGQQLYFSLWGRDAPPQYIEKRITDDGMNLWELEKFERSKPAFMDTKVAKDEIFAAAGQLTNFLGMGY